MVSFDASAPGTPEEHWAPVVAALAEEELDARGVRRALVVAAHADDETLGAGGVIARLTSAGCAVTVLCATDGAASETGLDDASRAALVARRSAELRAAMTSFSPAPAVIEIGLPDGGTREHRAELTRALAERLRGVDLLVAPWIGDGHRDHRVVGEVCEDLAAERGIRLLRYPVWLWHWGDPASPVGEFDELRRIPLTEDERAARRAALGAYASQTERRGAAGPVLRPEFLAHFDRDADVVVAPRVGDRRARHFEQLHHDDADPWRVDSSWYERRKAAMLLALLDRERYASALEIGCSTGVFTRALAARADRVLAVDIAPSAVAAARERTGDLPGVDVLQADVRRGFPDIAPDLVVLSEVGYYLSPGELGVLLDDAARHAADGRFLACHWTGWSDDLAQTGAEVHAAIDARFERIAEYRDERVAAGLWAIGPRR